MINRGYYGELGGAFIPEILTSTFEELVDAFEKAKRDPGFWNEYLDVMSTYSCRPTPLTFAGNLTRHFRGARIYVKREDLNHTGAHKANNVMGQGLLVKRMGKSRVIAETGAGQHGRQIRLQVYHLYGRGGRGKTEAQCFLDGAFRRRGHPCKRRDSNTKRRHK